jgi:hypothetical protein
VAHLGLPLRSRRERTRIGGLGPKLAAERSLSFADQVKAL